MRRKLPPALLLLAAAGCAPSPATAPAAKSAAAPPPAARGDTPAALAAHPFWRAKVTPAQVEALAAKVRAQQGGALAFVDDRCAVVVRGAESAPWNDAFRDRLRHEGLRMRPDTLGDDGRERRELSDRWFHLDTARWRARPSEAEVLAALKAALDAADYRP